MFVGHIDRFPAQSYLAPKLLSAMKTAFSRIQDLPAHQLHISVQCGLYQRELLLLASV
ncbi:hypothetical protein PDPUS_2_00508 [Photobacterium damselae subsp. piscicida]|uniref:Uncharacterized protein n=1 Tax=Photobacterium damsela subsp. piscicida TaxID=38294 RepID=A0AAD1CJ29_PHODP|nr:hypothetical protein PDPUS_2_00508 [Photobacterium damselae subsp. piscicida]GAW46515.1 hypothetical protein PDPJ_2_00765 [Photobacterium damselae subsp. piscicida]